MMAHEGDGSCIAREEILRREGRNVASRGKKCCVARERGMHRDAEKRAF